MLRSARAFAVAAVTVVACLGLSGQTPQAPSAPSTALATGLIAGRVVDATTSTPVTGAVVTIAGPGAPQPSSVVVDSRGRFVFANLPRGQFTITTRKNGYVAGAFGKIRVDGAGQPLDLGPGQRVTDVTIRTWALASIEGTVTDENGEPVVRVIVDAFQRSFVAGHPSLSTRGGEQATDDRGMFYDPGLVPGDYVLVVSSRLITYPLSFVEADAAAQALGQTAIAARSAQLAPTGANRMGGPATAAAIRIGEFAVAPFLFTPPPNGTDQLLIFPVTYYAAASTVEAAAPLTLGAGEHRTGINVVLRHTPTVRVSGVATGPSGPIPNLQLSLQMGGRNDFRSRQLVQPAETVTAADGRFTFLGIPSGQYVIWAQVGTAAPGRAGGPGRGGPAARGGLSDPDLSAAVPVTVADADLTGVQVALRRNPTVAGRVEFEGLAEKPPSVSSVRLFADEADGHYPIVAGGGVTPTLGVDADGQILPRALAPGAYFIRSDAPPPGWTLKSAMVAGRDVSDVPLVLDSLDVSDLLVTFTDHPIAISGAVRTPSGAIDPSAVVLIFPADPTRWTDYGTLPRRVRSVSVGRNGTFSVSGLAAGEYLVVATQGDALGQWQDPKALERAARVATHVRLDEGANATVDLRTVTW